MDKQVGDWALDHYFHPTHEIGQHSKGRGVEAGPEGPASSVSVLSRWTERCQRGG
jgi:hypothetical protein